jgi:hypothetical protein
MTTVKYLNGAMAGCPTVSNNWGDLTNMLDACLVNGFNLRSPVSVTRSGSTVTLTFATSHGYQVHQVVEVSGAAQPAYNGQFHVTWTDTLSMQYTLPAGVEPTTPASGTISVKVAPLGFDIAFTGTNKRVYRSPNVQGNRPFIRVEDSLPAGCTTTWAKFARVTIAESMSDVDTFLPGGRAPFSPGSGIPNLNEQGNGVSGSSGIFGWHKWYFSTYSLQGIGSESSTDPGGLKNWSLVGDDRFFYLVIGPVWYGARELYAAGEFPSYKAGDAYNTLLFAKDWSFSAATSNSSWATHGGNARMHDFDGRVAMRGWQQIGNTQRLAMLSLDTSTSVYQAESGHNTGLSYPNGPDMGTVVHPIYLREESPFSIRGVLPGAYWALQNGAHSHRTIFDNLTGLPGRRLVYLAGVGTTASVSANNAGLWFDITGPWR